MTTNPPTQERVGHELARLRSLAGISGRQMAVRLGVSQPTVSRFESGSRLLSLPQAEAWLDAVRADVDVRARVLALVETSHSETLAYRQRLRSDRHMQGHVLDLESQAESLYGVDPVVIPGLLQVPDYAAAVMKLADSGDGVDKSAALEARLRRQDRLTDESRTFSFVLLESALRASIVSATQLEHLAAIATDRPNITLGLVPHGAAWPAVPWNGFILYDLADGSSVVLAELAHGEARITGDDDIRLYRDLHDDWLRSALIGVDAADFCRRLAVEATGV